MSNQCLVVIDVQNDFCPGGALAVTGGDEIIAPVNALIEQYAHVVLTQDWHPSGHSSFASQHEGHAPFDTIDVSYGKQTLWPDHCIQGSDGARFHADLNTDKAELIIRKGFHPAIDSYSAFFENDKLTPTGLAGYLDERDIDTITLVGLATDFCVGFSALDAVRLGFDTRVELAACRAIDLEGSCDKMLARLRDQGVTLA